ncbi:hypothetical protein SDC9_212610 [bioreactor metagenome]|uniref:Uncharacterized protein n=1 Tax=bioreactor metagenome TaxID=1076179 RepID=A0A645K129_9ZZZZ
MTQRSVVRKLLTCLVSVQFDRLHQAINVAFQYHTVIYDGCDFIDYLWGSETGIRDHGDTEKQRFPVLHTFSISINRDADYVVNQSDHKEL